jgi:AraC-like DNA-binding protein
MNDRVECAPEGVGHRHRPRHWQFGRAHLIHRGDVGGLQLGFTQRSGRPYDAEFVTVGFQSQGSGAILVIPAADLGLPSDVIRRATRVPPSGPVHGLLQEHLDRLFRDADKISQLGDAAMVGRATTELVRALVSSTGRDPGSSDMRPQALETRLVTYIEQHLQDPDLRAEELARVHRISVRQLYKLWSSRETSLTQWIIHQRLEGARGDLSAADAGGATIEAVARRWGFTNVTHFSRRFREVYCMSPREWQRVSCRIPLPRSSSDLAVPMSRER